MTLWTEDTEQRADMAHWLGHGRCAGPQGDARWRAMGLRHVLMLCETAERMEWKPGDGRASWPPPQILDYGCGGGANVAALGMLGCSLISLVDVSEESMREAQNHDGQAYLWWLKEGEHESHYGAESIRHDAALCTAVLQHVDPDEARHILRTIHGAMAPGGVALISTRRPIHGTPPGDVSMLTVWTSQEARTDLERAGFRIVRHIWEGTGYDYWGCERV